MDDKRIAWRDTKYRKQYPKSKNLKYLTENTNGIYKSNAHHVVTQ